MRENEHWSKLIRKKKIVKSSNTSNLDFIKCETRILRSNYLKHILLYLLIKKKYIYIYIWNQQLDTRNCPGFRLIIKTISVSDIWNTKYVKYVLSMTVNNNVIKCKFSIWDHLRWSECHSNRLRLITVWTKATNRNRL